MGWGQDWGTAPYGDPGAPLLDYIEGFEHQTLDISQFGGSGVGIFDSLAPAVPGAALTFVAGRTGVCLRVTENGTSATNASVFLPLTRTRVFSGYFRCAAPPSGTSRIWSIQDSAGNQLARLTLLTTGVLRVGCIDGPQQDSPSSVCDGAWHLIDVAVDSSCLTADTWTMAWALDGTPGPTVESDAGKVATDLRGVRYGTATTTGEFATIDWDDCVSSAAIGSYPIGAHEVKYLVPTSDGTHVAGANVIEANTGTDIGVTTAFNLLDEWPANTTDYVRQAVTGTGNYAEVQFTDATDPTIWGVSAVAALFSASTAANHGITRIITDDTGSTVADIYAGDMSQTGLHYRTMVFSYMGASWTTARLNFLRARVGFSSDATPDPHWSALMIQYAVGVVGEPQTLPVPRIGQPGSTFQPTVLRHPRATLGLISRVGVARAPRVRKTMVLGAIDQTGTVFAPSQFTQQVTDAGPFDEDVFDEDVFETGTGFYISPTVEVFAPEFTALPQTVSLPGGAADGAFDDDTFQGDVFQVEDSPAGTFGAVGTAFAPSLTGQGVAGQVLLTGTGGWDSGDIDWDGDTAWDASGLGGQINQSGQAFAPSLTFSVTLDLIDQSAVAFAPSPGSTSFNLPFIDRSGFTYTPQQVKGSISLEVISSVGTVSEPVVEAPQEVELDFIDQTPVLFAFQLNQQEIQLPFINRAGFTYTPQQVSQNVALDPLASTVEVFAPEINAVTLLGVIAQVGVAFEPGVVFNADDVELDLIDQSPVVFEPPLFLIPFQQTVRLDETAEQFIDNAGVVFSFVSVELGQPQDVFLGFIDRRGTPFDLRVLLTRFPVIVLRARHMPVITERARHDPVISKHAKKARQG